MSGVVHWLTFWIVTPALTLLQHPFLLGELGFIAGILVFSLFRPLGLPLLFWNERAGVQRVVGITTTLLAAQIFFVVYLSEATSGPGSLPLVAWFVVVWGSVVVLGARTRLRSRPKPTEDDRGRLTSPIKEVQQHELRGPVYVEVSPWPFVQGALLAGAGLALLWAAVDSIGPWLDRRLLPAFHWLDARVERSPSLHLLAFLSVALVGTQFWLLRRRAPPAAGLCMLLSLVAAVDGASSYWMNSSGLTPFIALLVLIRAGTQVYSIRIAELAPVYADPVPYPPKTMASDPEPMLPDRLVTKGAIDEHWPDRLPDKRPLILVCTSGGGIRAATWTAGVLARLNASPRFSELTLMLTGASGGMVGASAWVAALHRARYAGERPTSNIAWSTLTAAVGQDSLTDLARTWIFSDIPRAFSVRPKLNDRGQTLQEAWNRLLANALGCDLKLRVAELREGERQRWWPSLVFTPAVIEDGRRLLISNLRLAPVLSAELPWLAARPGGPPERGLASTSAYHVADIFGASSDELTLATAARLSASFPYVSPVAVLPTEPRMRVADAGYYDNYGVDLVTAWLREAWERQRPWIEQHVSRILVIQIRDEPSALTRTPDAAPESLAPTRHDAGARLARALEGLSGPVQGMLAARDSVMRFRNDAQLDAVSQAYASALGENFCMTQIFELKGSLSLSWYLTDFERNVIDQQLDSDAVSRKIADVARWIETEPARDASRPLKTA